MDKAIPGIHHITAITADAQANVDFYTDVLGLRLVKLTVNFDDPGSYHLYYGDGQGSPGSILTFFEWPNAYAGRQGTQQVATTAFSVPAGSLPQWQERLNERGIPFEGPVARFDDEVLFLRDPDGLQLELVANDDPRPPWEGGPLPAAMAIRGFHSAALSEEGYERTAQLLTATMGLRPLGSAGNRFRFEAGAGGPGAIVDVLCQPDSPHGSVGAGAVHHIAWRTRDDEEQLAWRADLVRAGYNVSPVLDRQYFHSIYFREEGGVLFEIATDPPGFTADEPLEQLGTTLKLPPWLERARTQIEALVRPLRLPGVVDS
jgi:glyoxalase family protein